MVLQAPGISFWGNAEQGSQRARALLMMWFLWNQNSFLMFQSDLVLPEARSTHKSGIIVLHAIGSANIQASGSHLQHDH